MEDPFAFAGPPPLKKTMPNIQIKQYPSHTQTTKSFNYFINKTDLIPSLPEGLDVIQAGQQSEIDGSVQLDLLDEDSDALGLQVEEIIFLSYG